MNKEQILYEDKDILVCYKPAGLATQTARVGQPDMVSEVANYLSASGKALPYVGLVHRLDQPVEGLLVFGKEQKAAGALSRQISDGRMEKYYYAIVNTGKLSGQQETASKGTLVDYLYKDAGTNTSHIVPKEKPGAKRAELSYRIIKRMPIKEIKIKEKNYEEIEEIEKIQETGRVEAALVEIKLVTGRHHQIRVQMSHAGMSLFGDHKYADEQTKKVSEILQQKQIALCAHKLCFFHPATGKRLAFQKEPEGYIFQNFFE
ncbi:MAG: RluA family pseudouridine synthase [Roseburia sp.]|nr:RluA family pseudouridine synthase [Roseburia sp.]MCM1242665.1 RluA family pseudouridine synthase [Roseburia sp.]